MAASGRENWLQGWLDLVGKALETSVEAGLAADPQRLGLASAAIVHVAESMCNQGRPCDAAAFNALVWTAELCRVRQDGSRRLAGALRKLEEDGRHYAGDHDLDEAVAEEFKRTALLLDQAAACGFNEDGSVPLFADEALRIFDEKLFLCVASALRRNTDLRSLLVGAGASLAAARGSRTARALSAHVPLAEDTVAEREEKQDGVEEQEAEALRELAPWIRLSSLGLGLGQPAPQQAAALPSAEAEDEEEEAEEEREEDEEEEAGDAGQAVMQGEGDGEEEARPMALAGSKMVDLEEWDEEDVFWEQVAEPTRLPKAFGEGTPATRVEEDAEAEEEEAEAEEEEDEEEEAVEEQEVDPWAATALERDRARAALAQEPDPWDSTQGLRERGQTRLEEAELDPWEATTALREGARAQREDPWEATKDLQAQEAELDPWQATAALRERARAQLEDPWETTKNLRVQAERDPWEATTALRERARAQREDPWEAAKDLREQEAELDPWEATAALREQTRAPQEDPWEATRDLREEAKQRLVQLNDPWEATAMERTEAWGSRRAQQFPEEMAFAEIHRKGEMAWTQYEAETMGEYEDEVDMEQLREMVEEETSMAWAEAEAVADQGVPAVGAAAEASQAMASVRLPIEAKRSDILARIRRQRVTIIVGATGCGKSTKVPQFLLDEPGARVLVTQPRRVAAVEIARRVATERGERLGQSVGYRIAGEKMGKGPLTFATVGYALAWFLGKPEKFSGFTHIVLDEVHERGADMEMFLLMTKLLMAFFPDTKLVLMSATLQAGVFSEYYKEFMGEHDTAPISVEGRTFPVREVYLDDLADSNSEWSQQLGPQARMLANSARANFDKACEKEKGVALLESPEVSSGLQKLALALVPIFAQRDSTLLVFLPGIVELGDLAGVFEALEAKPGRGTLLNPLAPTRYRVFVMHSMVSRADQEAVFVRPTDGTCNVVLASNIAESSLTLPNVTAVIDFGLHREVIHDPKLRLSRLVTSWCSQASARQRSGRAGRTQPGVGVRLFTRRFFEVRMPEFDTPEILRASLSKLVLRAKKLSKVLENAAGRWQPANLPIDLRSVKALVRYLPQAPDATLLDTAFTELASCGALAGASDTAEMTSLGNFAEGLPLDLGLCRLLWLGALWGCAAEATVMAAACASGDPFTSPSRMFAAEHSQYVADLRRALGSRGQFDGGHFSEPVMWLRLFVHWATNFVPRRPEGRNAGQTQQSPGWGSACRKLAEVVAISPAKMMQLAMRVSDLSERMLKLTLPGGATTSGTARRDLEGLRRLISGGNVDSKQVFRADAPMLKMLLATAFCEQLLVGRRFMDQLRGPQKKKGSKDTGLGALAVTKTTQKGKDKSAERGAGRRGEVEGEEEELDDEEGEKATEFEDEDEEIAALLRAEEATKEQEVEDEEEEFEEDDELAGGAGAAAFDDDEGSETLPWLKARNEMLDAVNSLKLRSIEARRRVLVVPLKGPKDAGTAVGAIPIDKVGEVMEKICGKRPTVGHSGPQAKYAAALFPVERRPPPATWGGVPDASPPVLDGATSDAALCYTYPGGRSLFTLDDLLVARPTSPYLLSFFLPERDAESDEAKQKLVKALFDSRSPVGFPCHTRSPSDFVCVSAGLQLTESMLSVRAEGATVLHAAQLVYALAALSPDRAALAFQVGNGPRGTDAPGVGTPHIVGVRVNGWEVSLVAGGGVGLPLEPTLELLGRVREELRQGLRLEELGEASLASARRRKLRKGALDQPAKTIRELMEVVEAAVVAEEVPAAEKRANRVKQRAKPWREAVLAGEPDGHVDFLRPLELAAAGVSVHRSPTGPTGPFRCPVCKEAFETVSACQSHLKKTKHLELERGMSWKSFIENRCLMPGFQLRDPVPAVPAAA